MTPLIALLLIAAAHEPGSEADLARANAQSSSDWSITLGGGVLTMPSYPGAGSSHVMPMPFFEVQYRQLLFLSPMAGLGINAVSTPELQAGVAVQPDLGRAASSGDRLRGWGDVSPGADLKAFGMYSLGRIALLADVRRQLGAGNGTLIDAGATGMLVHARHLMLTATAAVSWADGRYTRAYFGVDRNQSAAALAQGVRLPAYAAGAGFRDVDLTLVAIVPIDDRWSLQSMVRAEILLGDAARSPLTETRVQPMVGGAVAYRL
jgi:outer membrane scaffolding protein for murein synthesis (MipA/OmpV family)